MATARQGRLWTIASREYRVQVTGALFAALVLLLIAATSTLNPVAMIPGGADIDAPVRVIANSVHALSPSFAMGGFFVYPLFASLMAGLSVLRDDEAGVTELLQSTPLTTGEYLWAKFGGVMGALATAMLLHIGIMMLFREFAVGGVARGPFSPSAYVVAAGLFLLPTVLWCAGLSFVIGTRTRTPMAVYALPVLLYMAEFRYFWNWHPPDINPRLDAALMMLDPTGLRWLMYHPFTDDRGALYYNSAALAVDGVLLAGRLFVMLLPLLGVYLLVATARRSTRVAALTARSWLGLRRVPVAATSDPAPGTAAPRGFQGLRELVMQQRTPQLLHATGTVLVAELRALARRPSLYLFALLLSGVVTEFGGTEADAYGSTAILTGGGIAVSAMPAVTILMCLFLLFVVVESLHRDRTSGFEAILFSSPVPTSALVSGRMLAVFAVVSLLSAVCIASGASLLLAQGRWPTSPGTSLWQLLLVFGAVLGPTYALWVAFVTAVMTVTRSRTKALAIGLVALLLTGAQFMRGSLTWVSNWPLWGALTWTEFGLFPLDGAALLWNRLTALLLTITLCVAARFFFVRTEPDPVAARAQRTPQRRRMLALRAVPLVCVPFMTGAFMAIQIRSGFEGPTALRAAERYEESNQRTWSRVVPAVIQHIDASIGIVPSTRQLDVDGSYVMVNETAQSMQQLPFTVPHAFGPMTWTVNGRDVPVQRTDGLHVLRLELPLASGDTVQVGFRYSAGLTQGFSRNGARVPAFVTSSSVLLSTHRGDFLPVPGYSRRAEVSLTPVASAEVADTSTQAPSFNRGWPFTAEVRVRAPRVLTMNGVGVLAARVSDDTHTTSTWVTKTPVAALSIVGGTFAVQRDSGVAVYYRPGHDASVGVMLATLSAARARYSEWFFPYPWEELRLNEHADFVTQATSYPTNIAFSEGIGFLTTTGPEGGLAFAVTAHEAAHQWWGHLLMAGTGPGTGLLVEGMADYATLLLYDEVHGPKARQVYATVLERQYLDRRRRDNEKPLLETLESSAADRAVLQQKGAWVMWMLQQELGDTRMYAGLRSFIEGQRRVGSFAVPQAMLAALRNESSDTVRFDAFVEQWFRGTGLPLFTLRDVRCDAVEAAWDCAATLHNTGNAAATVSVAAMRSDTVLTAGTVSTSVAADARVALRWRVSARPDRLLVDPDVRVLQEGRAQALAEVPPTVSRP